MREREAVFFLPISSQESRRKLPCSFSGLGSTSIGCFSRYFFPLQIDRSNQAFLKDQHINWLKAAKSMAHKQHQHVLTPAAKSMAHRQHQLALTPAAGSTRHGFTKVTDDLKHGKVITEQYIPIAKQVTTDYQNGKVTTIAQMKKKTTTKDYRKGTVTTEDRTTAKCVTEDSRKGIKTTQTIETTKTSTKDCRNTGPVVIKQSHHSSIFPKKTSSLVKGKAYQS